MIPGCSRTSGYRRSPDYLNGQATCGFQVQGSNSVKLA
jgi:hypothetical protein